mmetsp:Transcript_4425/g.12792  ORF Transcript_4425/g.12792 Transcript_4425/m.12792 type:complete len:319 (+) Transcript_4425:803-1759(+)
MPVRCSPERQHRVLRRERVCCFPAAACRAVPATAAVAGNSFAAAAAAAVGTAGESSLANGAAAAPGFGSAVWRSVGWSRGALTDNAPMQLRRASPAANAAAAAAAAGRLTRSRDCCCGRRLTFHTCPSGTPVLGAPPAQQASCSSTAEAYTGDLAEALAPATVPPRAASPAGRTLRAVTAEPPSNRCCRAAAAASRATASWATATACARAGISCSRCNERIARASPVGVNLNGEADGRAALAAKTQASAHLFRIRPQRCRLRHRTAGAIWSCCWQLLAVAGSLCYSCCQRHSPTKHLQCSEQRGIKTLNPRRERNPKP